MNRVLTAFAVFLIFTITQSAVASERSLRFTDSSGHEWQRWIITERQNERTLLLVVENPVNSVESVSQKVIYRHSFARGSRELQNQITRFENRSDQSEKDFVALEDPAAAALPITASSSKLKVASARATHQPIWIIKQNYWTLQDERNYTAWMQNTVTETFLQGSGVIVDCADLSLTLRWVYAHDHGLPAANSLSGAGGLFGPWSGTTAWDALATNSDWRQDARFKAALRYLLNSAYTHTILNDLYPTEISREYVTPGAIRLTITDVQSGHTQVIHHVGHDPKLCPDGQCVSVFYGDTPASETIFDDVAWLLNLKKGFGGFLRWRWPIQSAKGTWSLTAAAAMPGYSLEQFSHPSFTTDQYETYFNTAMFWSTTITDRATTLGYSMIQALQARLQVTALGYVFCYLDNCAPTSSAYDGYSTPTRDQRYQASQARFNDLVTNDAVDTTASEYQAFLAKAAQPLFAGGGLTYADYIFDRGGLSDSLISDPSRSFVERWGLLKATADQTQWANESLWETLWSYRELQVQNAQKLCYAGGSPTLTCKASDPSVKALATDDLDRALRSLRQTLRAQTSTLDSTTQTQLAKWASTKATAETGDAFCAKTPSKHCEISDFLYSSAPAVDRMSSVPTDDLADRFGY